MVFQYFDYSVVAEISNLGAEKYKYLRVGAYYIGVLHLEEQ